MDTTSIAPDSSAQLQTEQPPVQAPPPPPPAKRAWWRSKFVLIAGIVVIALAIGGSVAGSGHKTGATKTTNTQPPTPGFNADGTSTTPDVSSADTSTDTTDTTPAVTYATPRLKDFQLRVKTLSKECFGSAGCLITYRVQLGYTGGDLDPSVTYELTYSVAGDQSGPQVNTVEITGDQYTQPDEETADTASSRVTLKVRALTVEEQ